MVINFFKKLFRSCPKGDFDSINITDCLTECLSKNDRRELDRSFSKENIFKAIRRIEPKNARAQSGGIHANFCQIFWEIVGVSILETCK